VHYVAPTSLAEALDLMATGDLVALAGGTDFYPAQVDRPLDQPVLDITGIGDIRGIAVGDDVVRIGALTTWSEIAAADLPAGCRALQQAAVEVGGRQIQNVASIGGNLCNASPAADGIPPLLITDASVELASATGTRRVPLDEFLVGYRQTLIRRDEILTAVLIPTENTVGRSSFLKLGSRRYLVISIAMVAASVQLAPDGTIEVARVAVGACSPVAQRLVSLEADLRGVDGAAADQVVAAHHFDTLAPIDDPRAPASYRMEAAKTLVARAVDSCLGVA
jgi:CO/xanthine dehydrogenase FAD-binding subunit